MSRTAFQLQVKHQTWIQVVVAILVYAILTALITWDFLPRLGSTLFNWGDALQQTWTLGWNAQQFLRDPLQLYEAPIFFPFPHSLAFSDTLVPQSALALPIILATNNLALAHNASILLAFVLNGLGMFLLLRVWKINFWGALIGGAIFAFGNYHLSHFGHLNLLSTQWMPFTILFLDCALRKPRAQFFFLFGLSFFLSATSSFYYAFITGALVLLYAGVLFAHARGKWSRQVWAGLIFSLGIVFLCLLPFGLPYIELYRAFGLQRDLAAMKELSAAPSSYLASVSSHPPFDALRQMFPPLHGEAILSPGVLAWLLALLGIFLARQWRPALALVVIGIAGFMLSLGPAQTFGNVTVTLPYQWLYDWVPGFGGAMRALARWGVLVLFAVAAFAGFGFSKLTEKFARAHFAFALGAAVLVLGGMYWEYDQTPMRLMTGTLIRQPTPTVYEWLATQPEGAVLELPFGDQGVGTARDVWYQYYSLLHRHRLVNGNLAIAPLPYAEIARRVQNFPSTDAIELARALGVRYIIVHAQGISDGSTKQARAELFSDALELAHQSQDAWAYRVLPRAPEKNSQARLVIGNSLAPNETARAYLIGDPSPSQHQIFSARGLLNVRAQWFAANGNVVAQENARVRAPLLRDENGALVPFVLRTPLENGAYRLVVQVEGLADAQTFEQSVQIQNAAGQMDAPAIQLADVFVARRAARAGEWVDVTLTWKVLAPLANAMNLFIQVRDKNGDMRAQLNEPLRAGELGTSAWQPGEIKIERYAVPLPRGLSQGTYSLVVGLTNPQNDELIPSRAPDDSIETAHSLDTPVYIGKGWNAAAQTPPFPLRVDFDSWARLAGYTLPTQTFHAGESVPLTLYWIGREHTAHAYQMFVHLVNARGEMVAQRDAPPLQGAYPTSAWNEGEWIRDAFALELPPDLEPGKYEILVGWYDLQTGARVLTREDVPQDHVRLATIEVVAP